MLHVLAGDEGCVPRAARECVVGVRRAAGVVDEPQVSTLADASALAIEWEWEDTPEVSLALVDGVAHAAALFNAHSPQFVASLVSDDAAEKDAFYYATNAPFVGDGFTRWVDGQYALKRPELGLANWERGRLFGRGGVVSGDSVYTVRAHMTQTDPRVRRLGEGARGSARFARRPCRAGLELRGGLGATP